MMKRLYLATVVGALDEDEVDIEFPTLEGMRINPIGTAPLESSGGRSEEPLLEAGSTIALFPCSRDDAGKLVAVIYQAKPPLEELHPK